MTVSRDFRGRRKREAEPDRLPPGQYVTDDFPVLSAGPTPHTPLEQWSFSVVTGEERLELDVGEFRALPTETVTRDIHCVTRWSKFDTTWEGVSLDTLLEAVEPRRPVRPRILRRRLHHEPARRGRHRREGLGRLQLRRRAARPRARRPGAPARAAPLLLEEREVGSRPRVARRGRARLLGDVRLPHVRRPVAGAAVLRGLSWQLATVVAGRRRDADACGRRSSIRPTGAGASRRASTSTFASLRRTATAPNAPTRSPRHPASPWRSRSSASTTARSRRT